MFANIYSTIAQIFGAQNDDQTPTGAEAVVTDYSERNNLPDHMKETVGYFDSVERVTISGTFNERAVANITIDLGEYGDYTITVDIEDELPELMDSFSLEVADLQRLVDNSEDIPMIRDGGEWRIKWEELDDWDLYSEDEEPEESAAEAALKDSEEQTESTEGESEEDNE